MLVVSTVVFAAACGSGGESSESGSAGAIPTTTRLLEQAPAPDPVTAEGVAVTALREIFTWRPADEEHGESMRRARKYLGPSLIRTLDSAPAEEPSPSLRWAEWAKAGARVDDVWPDYDRWTVHAEQQAGHSLHASAGITAAPAISPTRAIGCVATTGSPRRSV
ncbi:hypothetical protein [Nocardia farcinica]|uniref:hypothetical protein n=1 Tax=Nocardia farcinica TaxID=37329 RepID=UPI00245815A8|nr:hypothetical protein [Nocardia farcinica]